MLHLREREYMTLHNKCYAFVVTQSYLYEFVELLVAQMNNNLIFPFKKTGFINGIVSAIF